MRILEDDIITIFGVSSGLITYTSTLGGNITIPAVSVEIGDRIKKVSLQTVLKKLFED